MEARMIVIDRERVIRVLEEYTDEPPEYQMMPSYSCKVGGYVISRDGWIRSEDDGGLKLLASLGLCDYPAEPEPEPGGIFYRTDGHTGASLLRLISIISARHRLINQAINVKNAFFAAPSLVTDMSDHPPVTIPDFLQQIHGRDDEYAGLEFSREYIVFSGFRRAAQGEQDLCRQLADRIVDTAVRVNWTKAFTKNVRNRKYAMRTWLNAMGMTGPEYAELRHTFLGRLPGSNDKRMK